MSTLCGSPGVVWIMTPPSASPWAVANRATGAGATSRSRTSMALAVSAFLLYVFGRFDAVGLRDALHVTVVLGVPATVGAAAARLTLDA